MHQCNEREDEVPSQTQQPQPAAGAEEARAACAGPFAIGLGQPIGPDTGGTAEQAPAFDRARFSAGVVRFYEAVLKEPVPGKMLRLIEEIAMRERKL